MSCGADGYLAEVIAREVHLKPGTVRIRDEEVGP
jgi:hypothetical protein